MSIFKYSCNSISPSLNLAGKKGPFHHLRLLPTDKSFWAVPGFQYSLRVGTYVPYLVL